MLKIALTGGIGCGKTTICSLFSKLEVPIIDTDIISRELVEPGQQALTEITDAFGKAMLDEKGELDRKKLAKRVFSDTPSKITLESILHPKIRARVKRLLEMSDDAYAIVAIPLLFETKQQDQYDRVLVVDCSEQQQIERTLARDQRTLDEIQAIIQTQISREERKQLADDIIDNSGSLKTLSEQVNQLHQRYLKLS